MHYILTTLHTLLNANPFRMELAVLGILAFGWILGRTNAEYAETLKRSSAGGLLIAGLCGPPTLLLGLGMIVDSIWLQSYTKLPLMGGLLLVILIVAAICQRLGQHAAHQVLMADGYEHAAMAILPKQRGS
jgi:hypothetical protein